jgi:hypothetical protein
VDHSPYYGEVRDALDKVMQGLTANDIQSVTSECKAFTWMLQSVVDEPEGRKTMEGFEAILLK